MKKIEVIADFEKRFEVMGWNNSFQTYVPVYFIYNDKKCFIHNRRIYGVPYGTPEARYDEQNYIDQLRENDGRYFCLYNGYRNGIRIDAFLQWIWEKGYTLSKDFNISRREDGSYVDIVGNFKEVSCAFSYRIYDQQLAKRVICWMNEWNNEDHFIRQQD